MKESSVRSVRLRLVQIGVYSVLCLWSSLFGLVPQAISAEPRPAVPSSAPDQPSSEIPGCPSPVLPEPALFLGQYAKKSKARLYDEYTRSWVEKHWKMPPAKPGEPDVRKFIAPIVYPKHKWPPGGYYPPPDYPGDYIREHVEGLVIIEIKVAPSGHIESTRTVLSSGNKGLDAHTEQWVRQQWKFPPGEGHWYYWPVAYVVK